MNSMKRLIGGVIALLLTGTALAQENRPGVDMQRELAPAAPLVTAKADAKRVRFASPGSVVQLRLEVYDETGQKLFDTELRGGNVLDWHLQDGAGQILPSGRYACVLTIKSLSGRLSQRVGSITLSDKKATMESPAMTQLSAAQQQIIGPLEANNAFTVLQESGDEALTTVAHNGQEGQVTRTRGALSFRMGDFFSGKDKEQMRLTEEGKLGIGTSAPEVMLDVAGMIRAREGLMFSDGSTLKINEKGVLTRTPADGSTATSVSATQNRIVKFTDNAGTLGDSVMTELAGNIGVANSNPGALVHIGPFAGYGSTTGLLLGNNLLGTQFDRALQVAPVQTASPGTNSILLYALPTINAGITVPRQYGFFIDGKQGAGAVTSYAALGTGQVGSLGAINNTHLLMGQATIPTGNYGIYDATGYNAFFNGSVGIGTNSPGAKLDVTGNINTATQYNIGGQRVLSIPAPGNVFVGAGAGASNSTGSFNTYVGTNAGSTSVSADNNSFFGYTAGQKSTGCCNAFFGSRAGSNTETAAGNSFFGYSAGNSNTTGRSNSYFGSSAGVSNGIGNFGSFFGNNAGLQSSGDRNSFFGQNGGVSTTFGSDNSFFGSFAGDTNVNGTNNTIIGTDADVASGNLVNATAIGSKAQAAQSNSVILGSIYGVNGATADTNVGIGTPSPASRLHVQNGNIYVGSAGQGLILKSPDGTTCRLLTIDNSATLITSLIACP
jgi:hypothetical protein